VSRATGKRNYTSKQISNQESIYKPKYKSFFTQRGLINKLTKKLESLSIINQIYLERKNNCMIEEWGENHGYD